MAQREAWTSIRCYEAAAQTYKQEGREPNKARIEEISKRLARNMALAKAELQKEGRKTTRLNIVDKAAEIAKNQVLREAKLKEARKTGDAVKLAEREDEIDSYIAFRKQRFTVALGEAIAHTDRIANGMAQTYFARIPTFLQLASNDGLGFVRDKELMKAVAKALRNEDISYHPKAEQILRAVDEVRVVTDELHDQWVAEGGLTGDLGEDWHHPQAHSPSLVLNAAKVLGKEGSAKTAWIEHIVPLLDRDRYYTQDGDLMNDNQLRTFLSEAYDNIITGGTHDSFARGGAGGIGNRRRQARQIFFKDADSFLEYNNKFGTDDIYGMFNSHIRSLSRDVAIVQRWGSNANAAFAYLNDVKGVKYRRPVGGQKAESGMIWRGAVPITPQMLWDNLIGKANAIGGDTLYHANVAGALQTFSNIEVFSYLQKAIVSAVGGDIPTYFMQANWHGVFGDALANLKAVLSDHDFKDVVRRQGIVEETLIGALTDSDMGAPIQRLTGKLANATMRVEFLQAWTGAIKKASAANTMLAWANISRHTWDSLGDWDLARVRELGFDARTWDVIHLATPSTLRRDGTKVNMLLLDDVRAIAPEAIVEQAPHLFDGIEDSQRVAVAQQYRTEAIAQYAAMLNDETGYASLSTDLYARTMTNLGQQRATLAGELIRMVTTFKAAPFAFITRWLDRNSLAWKHGNKWDSVAAHAATMSVMTLFGALSLQAKEMLAGRDPRSMVREEDWYAFWFEAFLRGGAGASYADGLAVFLNADTYNAADRLVRLGGPQVSDMYQTAKFVLGNIAEAADGRDTHAGYEAAKMAWDHTPFVHLWYWNTLMERAIQNTAFEVVSPGHNARMAARRNRETGQQEWWKSDEFVPDRLPNVLKAIQP